MPNKDSIFQPQLAANLHHVPGIAGQRRIFGAIISREVRTAGADVVEQHDLEIVLKLRRHEAPHVLVAAETMGEHHAPPASSAHVHVVPGQYVHASSSSVMLRHSACNSSGFAARQTWFAKSNTEVLFICFVPPSALVCPALPPDFSRSAGCLRSAT